MIGYKDNMKLIKLPVIEPHIVEQTVVDLYLSKLLRFTHVETVIQYKEAGDVAINIDAIAKVFKNVDDVFVLSLNDQSTVFLRPETFAKTLKYFGKIIEIKRDHCMCNACKDGVLHRSDCAVHNMPAYPNGPCNCGAIKK
jgi:hypothetical protein